MGLIYLVTNTANGKCYVGKTMLSLERRKRAHQTDALNNSPLYFHRALIKYGFEAFIWRRKFISEDETELFRKEVEYIKKLGSKNPRGYNLTDGGEGSSGRVCSQETREKVASSLRGKTLPDHVKEKIRASVKRTMSTPEYKSKISKARKGLVKSERHRQNLSISKRGSNNPSKRPEVGKKIGDALRGRSIPIEVRIKISNSLRGIKKGPIPEHVRQAVIQSNKNRRGVPRVLRFK